MALNEVVGGIYSLQPLSSRWLTLLAIGALDSPMAHQTVRWHIGHPLFTVWCVPRQRAHWGLELLTVEDVCLFTAPDSLMNYSGACMFITVHLSSRPLARREPLLCWLTGQSGEL